MTSAAGDATSIAGLLTALARGSRLVALVGSGISVSAGIPTGVKIAQLLKRLFPRVVTSIDYATAMKQAFPGPDGPAKRRVFIERLCAGRLPKAEHYTLAGLAEAGYVSSILTTNFDHLLEFAFFSVCALPPEIYLHAENLVLARRPPGSPSIVKLHGDFLFDDIANLDKEMRSRLHRALYTRVARLFLARGLIVIGYGGRDKSVMKFLAQVAARPDCLDKGIWWVCRDAAQASAVIEEHGLASSLHRSEKDPVQILTSSGAHDFLTGLAAGLGLRIPGQSPFGIHGHAENPLFTLQDRWVVDSLRPPRPRRPSLPSVAKLARVIRKQRGRVLSIVGPSLSGKTTLAAQLFYERFRGDAFYYSPAFAMNNPLAQDWSHRLSSFLLRRAIPIHRLRGFDALIRAFKGDAVIIVDDALCLSTTHYLDQLSWLVAAQRLAGSGTIVFFSTTPLPQAFLARLMARLHDVLTVRGLSAPVLRERRRLRPADVGLDDLRLPRRRPSFASRSAIARGKEEHTLLAAMSLLRFAEEKEFFARVMGKTHLGSVLRRLAQEGAVKEVSGRFIIRDHLRAVWRRRASRLQRTVAQAYEAAAREEPTSPRAFHFAQEAENQYFGLGEYRKALELALSVARVATSMGHPEFVLATLSDFIRNPRARDALLEIQDAGIWSELVRVYGTAARRVEHEGPEAPHLSTSFRKYTNVI